MELNLAWSRSRDNIKTWRTVEKKGNHHSLNTSKRDSPVVYYTMDVVTNIDEGADNEHKHTKPNATNKDIIDHTKVQNSTSHSQDTSQKELEKGSHSEGGRTMDLDTQNRLRAFLEVAGVKLSHIDTQTFQDPEILRKLTNW